MVEEATWEEAVEDEEVPCDSAWPIDCPLMSLYSKPWKNKLRVINFKNKKLKIFEHIKVPHHGMKNSLHLGWIDDYIRFDKIEKCQRRQMFQIFRVGDNDWLLIHANPSQLCLFPFPCVSLLLLMMVSGFPFFVTLKFHSIFGAPYLYSPALEKMAWCLHTRASFICFSFDDIKP